MNILERIRKQYFDYMKEYGVYPNAVLLGRQDFQSLRSYVNVTCKTTKAVSVYTRPRVLGMLIFEATKENIIKVARISKLEMKGEQHGQDRRARILSI